ncbi:MAG: T9SS type A sorting domain-containing protein [Cruoricaptor ignavus]|nr:T9SS type A sorting domain-containing protein [Cruoricaptor ignavus]
MKKETILSNKWLPFCVILATVLMKIPILFTHHLQEDSFITWKVAKNVLEYGVIGFNGLDKISASTTHLYVLVSTIFQFLLGDNFIYPILIFNSLLFGIGSWYLSKMLFPTNASLSVLFVILLNLTPPALTASALGMEYGILFLSVTLLGIQIHFLMKTNFLLLVLIIFCTKIQAQSRDSKPPTNENTIATFVETQYSTADSKDYKLAPNSYIFDIEEDYDGLYIPVKKAYEMWASTVEHLGLNKPIDASQKLSAYVFWEDESGLIQSGSDYKLEIIGNSIGSKIAIPINKSVGKGNAVVSLHIGANGNNTDSIYWSWHIWVTDNPTNGTKYRQGFETRQPTNGQIEIIPDEDWGWMDRNLGATNKSLVGNEWKKSAGLLYQWGRKDPFPSLVRNSDDFYEIQGVVGKVRHSNSKYMKGAVSLNSLVHNSTTSQLIKTQIEKSIQNPLSLLYISLNYNNNLNLPYNWFGETPHPSYPRHRLARLNLWSDNSRGFSNEADANLDTAKKPYQTKSFYDPCPNGWRIPSMLVAHSSSDGWGTKDVGIRLDYSPFGLGSNIPAKNFEAQKHHIVKPVDNNVPVYMKGFRLYNKIGFDLQNVDNKNMGVFPGTGFIAKNKSFTDQHETYLWTATMMSWDYRNITPHVEARSLRLTPDGDQRDVPDSTFPEVHGKFYYYPISRNSTSDALACRCIKDPLYIINQYDFPTEYFKKNIMHYREGLDAPNSYSAVKSIDFQVIEIPVSKAFSVYNQYLSDYEMYNYDDMKTNVYWTTSTELIDKVTINNPNPKHINELKDIKILVRIKPNQAGNALITLHNGSINNPVYWSWHIWISNDAPTALSSYITEKPNPNVKNYINYVQNNSPLKIEFMDRNIGALNAFPIVSNITNPTGEELNKISQSGGFLYQYGRKDPMPGFLNPDGTSYSLYKGIANNSGIISYEQITPNTYENSYIVSYANYTSGSNITDKTYQKIRKNILYSINNPLVYMLPSSYSPVGVLGTDWVLDEPNTADKRWGSGMKKSVFDPCPEGWRIPNITSGSTDFNYQKGTTPWYKLGVNETTYNTKISAYQGYTVKKNSKVLGYQFNAASYSVGNYPFVGIRGFRANVVPQSITPATKYSGIWTSGLSSHYKGFAIGLLFDNTLDAIQVKYNFDPYMALSCRCVKDYENEDSGPIMKLPLEQYENNVAKIEDYTTEYVERKLASNDLVLFPNPIEEKLYINIKRNIYIEYKIFNMRGQLVKKGIFENSQTNLAELNSGVYLICVDGYRQVFKIIKK